MHLGAENVTRLEAAIRAEEPLQSVLVELETRGCHHWGEGEHHARGEGECYDDEAAVCGGRAIWGGRAIQSAGSRGGCSSILEMNANTRASW
jgi:hypothetical protein